MTLETLRQLAYEELKNLKEKATPEEIDKLDIELLDVERARECIYGLMTGRCDSERAKELTPKTFPIISTLEEVELYNHPFCSDDEYLTPLEIYLFLTDRTEHESIIKYLKS